jgi:hypothetical protein
MANPDPSSKTHPLDAVVVKEPVFSTTTIPKSPDGRATQSIID